MDIVFPFRYISKTIGDIEMKLFACDRVKLRLSNGYTICTIGERSINEPAQPLDINTLYNVKVVEEFIQLIVRPDVEIIANQHWTKHLK